ncbi:hypothetical protein SAMN05421788_1169 [Filimonas lacunae]|uniref:Novel STAND NTPase 3 domain-containing protein n=2 Tax=Filimonas lacunae TaxID=477680 RepID=A0A173MH31_9BACT|nr:hypothetical protein FLA_2807 [Filimonas lacunae]SIT34359.1 hypothetical protein SAMN05421788_1169 [Filimonas lacunae]
MNVTTAGVKGYEYQYKAIIALGLLNLRQSRSIFIEKDGGEDGQITITHNGQDHIVEVQMKDTIADISLSTFVKWLCHFPANLAQDNLLDRVINKKHTALIITSGRCLDDVHLFSQRFKDLSSHNSLKLTKTWQKDFCKELDKNGFTGSTTLQTKRNSFCKAQATDLQNSLTLEHDLSKILIWDGLTADSLDNEILQLLNRLYLVPQSASETLYFKLLEAVKESRDQKTDLTPIFKKLINEYEGEAPIIDPNYKSRSEESTLTQQLEIQGVLLLKGVTQAGKSELAKKIADYFHKKGFTYKICTEIEHAEQFLNLNIKEDKILVIEDPWGHVAVVDNGLNKWKKLENLIKNKQPQHKIIVTSRNEILQELSAGGFVTQNQIAGYNWANTTIIENKTLDSFWRIFADEAKLNNKIVKLIEDHISICPPDHLLQIGELQYLARYDQEDLVNQPLEGLLHIARHNSSQIASDIQSKDEETATILATLAISVDTITGISPQDLGYLLSEDNVEYGTLPEINWSNQRSKKKASYPEYKHSFSFTTGNQKALEYLERRGIIIFNGVQFFFTHPNFYEAGKQLITTGGTFRQTRIFNFYRKALSLLTPRNVILAAKHFDFLSNDTNIKDKSKVFELAVHGKKSIFPAARDICLVFLIKHISDVGNEIETSIINTLEYYDIDPIEIAWHEGFPFISNENEGILPHRYYTITDEDFKAIEDKFNTDQKVSPLDAWHFILGASSRNKYILNDKIFKYLIQYDEVFIRKEVCRSIFMQGNSAKIQHLSTLYTDNHPSVVFTAIRYSLNNWNLFDQEKKSFLLPLIKKVIKTQAVSVRTNRLFSTFSKEHTHEAINWSSLNPAETRELWNIWGELYPIYLEHLPSSAFLNPGRFGNTIDEAFKYLSKPIGMAVLDAWYNRIDFKITNNEVLDEFELCIADILLNFTEDDAAIRSKLFNKLLSYNDTSFMVSTLKWTVRYWDNLAEYEKKQILDLVKDDRNDSRWIKAVLLTCERPPEEIQNALFGESVFLLPPEEFIKKLDTQILSDSLAFYFGKPQPLWWLATQRKNIKFWQSVITYILENNIAPFFKNCMSELVFAGLNGFGGTWPGGMGTWKLVCNNTTDKKLVTEELIYGMTECSYVLHDTAEMIKLLHGRYIKDGSEEDFIKLLEQNIEALHYYGTSELYEVLGNEIFGTLLATIQPDATIIQSLEILVKENNQTQLKDVLNDLTERKKSVRMKATILILQKNLKKYADYSSFEELVINLPDNIRWIGEKEKEKFENSRKEKLPNWIGIN